MFRQIAVATLIVVGFMGTSASAHPRGFGSDCGVWWVQDCFGAGDAFSWREDELGFRTSCAEARSIVRGRGYSRVQTVNCGVRAHSFTGLRKGHKFLIKVNGYNGDIWSITRIN